MPDLRTFIDTVRDERPREVLDVYRSVNPRYETAAILTKLEQATRSPLVIFHQVAGSVFPVVSNVCGSPARLALALRCPVHELRARYSHACEHPLKPEQRKGGSVQQEVFTGNDVNLRALPQLVYHENDAPQPYITAAILVARDPETGKSNLSFHRLMITGRNTAGVFMARGKHLELIYRKYVARDEPMPIAAFIGVHPACSLGACYTGAADVEEYDVIGGLLGSPLGVVKCLTNELHVPAEAEFVLEGVISRRARVDEGPFGEFTGYATGTAMRPVFTVKAVTSRENPIFQDIVSGHAEHLLLPLAGMEHHLLSVAQAVVPTTTNVKVAVPLTAFVSVRKHEDSQPRQIMEALLSSDIYVKHVIVVDEDVDLFDLRQVASAVALHASADRVVIQPQALGTELDPSCDSQEGVTTKLGIDATLPLSSTRRITKNKVPQDVLDSINLSELFEQAVSPNR